MGTGRTDQNLHTKILIGSAANNMQPVKVEPHVEYKPGITEEVVCGEKKEVGFPTCLWTYPDMQLSSEQYYQLWNLTQGAVSGNVYIQIPTRDVELVAGTYQPVVATYSAVMRWPDEGLMRGMYDYWEIPEIEFTQLVAA